jgi:hypothetical protein
MIYNEYFGDIMKAMSLAIETIIVLVLAITVMGILLLFLNANIGPADSRLRWEREKNDACAKYSQYTAGDGKEACSQDQINYVRNKNSDLINELTKLCLNKQFKPIGCKDSLDENCLRECCNIQCPPPNK